MDTPAGASDSSVEFAAACDKIIIVLVGEPTSFMDAYAFIKALEYEKRSKECLSLSIWLKTLKMRKIVSPAFKKLFHNF